MASHIDLFEGILSHMPEHNYFPTDTEKIDWFLATIHESIYDSAKSNCMTQKISGTLQYGNMLQLFLHTCFARYPHFQIADIQSSKFKQNSSTFNSKSCVLHPHSNHTTEECKKLQHLKASENKQNFRPQKHH